MSAIIEGCESCMFSILDETQYPCNKCRFIYPKASPLFDTIVSQWKPLNGSNALVNGSNVLVEEVKDGSAINHPAHYQGKHECIDEMIALFGAEAVKAFCRCNVYKYRYRADKKSGAEDVAKADWYMDKLIELAGEQ